LSGDLEDIWEALEGRSTEDLVTIVSEQDAQEWRPEVFDMARSILTQRGVSPTDITAIPPPHGETDVPSGVDPADRGLLAKTPVSARPARRLVETLGVVLITCGYPILRHALADPEKQVPFDIGPFVAGTCSDIGWILLLCWLLSRDEDFKWNLPASRRGWIAEAALGYGLCLVTTAIDVLIRLSAERIGFADQPTRWDAILADPNARLAFRLLGPISALHQELLFRVYLQTRLSAILGRWSGWSVPMAAWLFAEVHGYPSVSTAAMFGVGLVFGMAYQVSRKIPRLVIAHAINLCIR
jgi:membrane protease YdiL (CAAX protease family)